MNKSTLKFLSRFAIFILALLALVELALAIWTVVENRYKSLAYSLADVGYIDLWILRYLSLCLFVSSIITLVMCLILIWGLYSAHVFLFIASTMIVFIIIGEFVISILTFTSKFDTRVLLLEQLPKLVITYRQGTDERANRALDFLQSSFRCCGSDGRLSFQNNVPLSCNMYSVGCLTRTMYFLNQSMDALAYVLLFFSLIKLIIVLFFYSYLCIYQTNRKNKRQWANDDDDRLTWRQSSSFESSSPDNLQKKVLLEPNSTGQQNDYVEQRHVVFHEEDPTYADRRYPSTSASFYQTEIYEPRVSRKLSSISEKTEKTETDDSEPDLFRLKSSQHNKRKVIITAVPRKTPLSAGAAAAPPAIKTRRRMSRDDEMENDSGVERSSSEKSFDDQSLLRKASDPLIVRDTQHSPAKASLSFSRVFLTSTSQKKPSADDELKRFLPTSSSSSNSLSDPNLFNESPKLKPILKKTIPQLVSVANDSKRKVCALHPHGRNELVNQIPRPIPRTSIKQDESLV